MQRLTTAGCAILSILAGPVVFPRAAHAETVTVDGMSGDDAWPEAYTAGHLANAARIGPQVTLTRMDMIGF